MDDWKLDVILILVAIGGISQVYLLIRFLDLTHQLEAYLKSNPPRT